MTRVNEALARTGGAKAAAVMRAPPDELGQLLGHVEARVAGRLTLDPGGDLPTLLQIKARRLKVDCGQHRAGTAAAPPFFLSHSEDAAAEAVAPQLLRQKKPLYPQEAQ